MGVKHYGRWHQQTFQPYSKNVGITENYSIVRAQILNYTYNWIGEHCQKDRKCKSHYSLHLFSSQNIAL